MAKTKNTAPPLKVLHVCGSHHRIGTEKIFLRLIQAQMRLEGYEVLPVVAADSWLAARLAEREIPCVTAPFKTGVKALFDKSTSKKIDEALQTFNPDVVQNWVGWWSRYLGRTDAPQIARVGLAMPKRTIKNSDYIVAATADMCAQLQQQGLPEDKIHHIPTLVTIPPRGFEDFRYDVRGEYNIPADANLVLLLGRLHESKGFDVALFALNLLPDSVHVLIVGKGSEYGRLRDAVEADGLSHRVHFTGWIDNTSPCFAAADSFLLPSRRQSSCNVILEAWAHKLPVVCTDIPSARGLVTHMENGLIVAPEDEVAIEKAIKTLVQDKKLGAKLARAGHKNVREAFGEKIIVNAYDALYHEAILEKKRKS